MARASADVQTDINSTSQKIDTLDTEIADCNQKKQNLIDKYDNLKDQKKIMDDSADLILVLQSEIVGRLETLISGSVCIQEIQDGTKTEIQEECDNAYKTAKWVSTKLMMKMKEVNKELDECDYQIIMYQNQQKECRSSLNRLSKEYKQAKEDEAVAAAGGM